EGYAADFAKALGGNRAVHTFSVNTIDYEEPTPQLEKRAEDYAKQVVKAVPEGPVLLAGFSMGAHLALATAQRLAADGREIGPVVVMDDEAELHKRHFGMHTQPLQGRAPTDYFQRALANSPARPFGGQILYLRAAANAADYRSDPTSGWGEIAGGGVVCHDLPGSHADLVTPDGLERIAEIVARAEVPAKLGDCAPDAALRYEIRLAARRGDLARECALGDQLIAASPDQPAWLYANHAKALFQNRQPQKAVAAYQKAIALDPWPLTTDLQFIQRFTRVARFGDLRDQALARARVVQPDHPSVYRQLGQFFELANADDEAERLLRAGLGADPNNNKLQRTLAQLLAKRGAHIEAADIYRKMVDRHPDLGLLHAFLGTELLLGNRPEEAIEVLNAAREVWPKRWQIHLALAQAAQHQGRREDVLIHAKRTLELRPTQPDAAQMIESLGQAASA
ncbi:MAG: thioesterase domain-containing protein, partial [Pseudomonadota bacterium]